MNTYIKMQLNNMISYLNGFEQACEMAAMKDDGVIDRSEERQLERIRKASAEFRRELEKVGKM
ncbi:MAG: hypothetical protein IKX74_00850 [Erysipelotrichaceae bacterium]|nr:hypothetical protein [Erysipelotrichaceae bacterium]MBO4537639.1 hypothetical protein [Erysipelotrichaceae bacterium]MBR5048195.1 hypothetical protein [Erysipelotrichaceae bacterium]